MASPKNTICVWYDKGAEAAARFYAETFPDSAISAVHRAPSDYPSGKAGDVLTVEFTVAGIPCLGLNGVPDRHRRPGGNRSILERDRRQWRPGKRLRLVQG
jgi:predicted 3-demethylubiquinone-9 3-methyltransferase (glyoxalase superfamily)